MKKFGILALLLSLGMTIGCEPPKPAPAPAPPVTKPEGDAAPVDEIKTDEAPKTEEAPAK